MKTWIDLETLKSNITLPTDYQIQQLPKNRVEKLIKLIPQWYPDIVIGSESCHLDPKFYAQETYLEEGDSSKDILPLIVTHQEEIVAFSTYKKDSCALTLSVRLGAVAPEHRKKGLGLVGVQISMMLAERMGAGLIYHFATLKHPYTQMLMEKSGFQVVGIIPAFDLDMVASHTAKRVSEAVYAKILAPQTAILKPKKAALTPSVLKLWEFLFGKFEE